MDRRDFLKACSVAGLGLVATQGYQREAHGAEVPLLVHVNAGGGWDPTMLADPKGLETGINQGFGLGEILTAGSINYAPGGLNTPFYTRFGPQMTVLNGIDCETNGHDTGQRNTWSGRLIEGSASLAALYADARASDKPLAFISNGGYDTTGGLIAPTRLGGNLDSLQDMIFPNRIDSDNSDDPTLFHTQDTYDRILAARAARLDRLQAAQRLPRIKNSMSLLYTAQLGTKDLKRINDFLPDDLGDGMRRQAAIGLAAYKAGLSVAVQLSTGGFDTHGDHDDRQRTSLDRLLQGIMDLYDTAEAMNIADQMIVVVGSEFGRTPRYNEGNGKDHFSVGSMMLMGAGITGNRVIGATDDEQAYRKVDPATNELSDGGLAIKNSHVHKWLRSFLGITGSEGDKAFPISVEGDFNFA